MSAPLAFLLDFFYDSRRIRLFSFLVRRVREDAFILLHRGSLLTEGCFRFVHRLRLLHVHMGLLLTCKILLLVRNNSGTFDEAHAAWFLL